MKINTLILMGGFAKRMWPVTKKYPKGLLFLGRRKILEIIISKILNLQNMLKGEIYISTNQCFAEQISKWLESMGLNVKIIVEEARSEDEKLGAVAGLHYDLRHMSSADGYLVIAGDNYFEDSLIDLVSKYLKVKKHIIALYKLDDIQLATKYGVATISDDLIVNVIEKPKKPIGDLVCTAIYIFTKKLPMLLGSYLSESTLRDRLGDFISWLVKKEQVYWYMLRGKWIDIGGVHEYLSLLREKFCGIHVACGAKILNSSFHDTVILDKGVSVINSKVRNSVILANTEIKDSVICNSLIGVRRRIVGKNVNNAIL